MLPIHTNNTFVVIAKEVGSRFAISFSLVPAGEIKPTNAAFFITTLNKTCSRPSHLGKSAGAARSCRFVFHERHHVGIAVRPKNLLLQYRQLISRLSSFLKL
jgi:hypothetical protein